MIPSLLATVIFNTLIAGFLTVVGVGGSGFGDNLVWSQCIGLAICVMSLLAIRANPPGPRRVLAVVGAVTAGTAIGIVLAGSTSNALSLLGIVARIPVEQHDEVAWQALFIGLFFGGIASAFFWLRERNVDLVAALEVGKIARLEAEKRGIEAQLKMLQAQIEPHFLFNTLANVTSLIESNPVLARRLLDVLIRYLRSSLKRTRAEGGTLGDEVGLLTAYLDVLKIRMGSRLNYHFDVPVELQGIAFPPMLLQPLVENAITHGLEPKVEGGTVCIGARLESGKLVLQVEDDGLGFATTHGGGVGLTNIRARLEALYGARGRLSIHAKLGASIEAGAGTRSVTASAGTGGVSAILEVPIEETAT